MLIQMTDVAVKNLCDTIGGIVHRLDYRNKTNGTAITIDGGGFQKMIAFGFATNEGHYNWHWIDQSFAKKFSKTVLTTRYYLL